MNGPLRILSRVLSLGALCLVVGSGIPTSAQILSLNKVSDTSGISGLGLDDLDLFGFSVTSVGDIDSDGVPDLVVGMPRGDDGGAEKGGVWILDMNQDGTVEGAYPIDDIHGWFLGTIDASDFFGTSVCGIGDLNGDGVEDLAVGAIGDDDGSSSQDRGAVWILFLKSDFTVDSHAKISATVGGFGGILQNVDLFGTSIANVGDIDGDGVSDLAVGATGADERGTNTGSVWILFMNTNGTVKDEAEIGNSTVGFTDYLDSGDGFGQSVAPLGDLNGDGTPDIVVGTIRDDDGGTDRGALWSIFLTPAGSIVTKFKISSTSGNFAGALDDYDAFGSAVCNIGDLNGDGIVDLVASAPGDDDGGTSSGALYILYLQSQGAVKEYYKIPLDSAPFTGLIDPEDYLGQGVANAGDLNGDGQLDLVVGAPGDDDAFGGGGIERGAAYVMHLGDGVMADQHIRNGTGVNNLCLTPLTLPRLGTTWQSVVDANLHSGQNPTFLVGYDAPLTLATPFGELLVATEPFGGTQIFFDVTMSVFWFGTHSIPIPNDPILEGFELSTQGGTVSSYIELCNAVDLRVGV